MANKRIVSKTREKTHQSMEWSFPEFAKREPSPSLDPRLPQVFERAAKASIIVFLDIDGVLHPDGAPVAEETDADEADSELNWAALRNAAKKHEKPSRPYFCWNNYLDELLAPHADALVILASYSSLRKDDFRFPFHKKKDPQLKDELHLNLSKAVQAMTVNGFNISHEFAGNPSLVKHRYPSFGFLDVHRHKLPLILSFLNKSGLGENYTHWIAIDDKFDFVRELALDQRQESWDLYEHYPNLVGVDSGLGLSCPKARKKVVEKLLRFKRSSITN